MLLPTRWRLGRWRCSWPCRRRWLVRQTPRDPPGQLQVIQIGSQVVAVDAVGNAVLYDYPPGQAPDCEGLEACWGFSARGAAGVVVIEGGDVVAVDVASGRVFVEERER